VDLVVGTLPGAQRRHILAPLVLAALAAVAYRQYRLDHQPLSRRAREVVPLRPLVARIHEHGGVGDG
jgi:hypothetical protein